jgi:hypothetical protein
MKRLILHAVACGLCALPLCAQVTLDPNSGATNTPPSGNYPGSGSSPQAGKPAPSQAPPAANAGGVKSTPHNGITPGSGAGGATNNVPAAPSPQP